MSDVLTLSGGGYTIVATDDLFIEAARLGQCASRADEWSATIARMLATDAGPGGLGAEFESTRKLEHAHLKAQQLGEDSRVAREALLAAMESYSDTERRLTLLLSETTPIAAWSLGKSLPLLLVLGALTAASVALMAPLLSTVLRIPIAKLPDYLLGQVKINPGIVNRPEFVRLLRSVASSGDEVVAGVAQVPSKFALPVGKLLGAANGAGALTALAQLATASGNRTLVETGQKVSQAGAARSVEPPHTIAALAERVPSSGGDTPQVRVERYGTEAAPRWVVYIAGTADFSPTPQGDPFDLTSNIQATAGAEAASERAVLDALRAAGASSCDPVLPIGHSQGGLLAARMAADPSLNVVGYVNLGGPLGAVDTADVPGVSLEHSEDLVPTLGGAEHSPDARLVVNRSVLGENPERAEPMAAHSLKQYRETAAIVSASDEARLQEFDRLVHDFTGNAPGVDTRWRAERVPYSTR